MSMRPLSLGGLALLLCLGLSPGLSAQTAEPAKPQPAPAPAPAAAAAAPAAEAPMPCSTCHDEAKLFVNNPHARGGVKNGEVPNDVCSTCHGDGTEHIAGGGDKTKITKPVGLQGSENTCMLCHNVTTDQVSRKTGTHSNTAMVNCLTCHSIHHSDVKSSHLVAAPQLQLCGNCHAAQTAMFRNKPYKHRLDRGGMECSSCHEPHGRPGRQMVRSTAAGEMACLGCHTDKRGPYVFPHGANAIGQQMYSSVVDCFSCHEPHGSSNPKMLKRANVWQLCIECHSPITGDTLGSQPPAFHNLTTARYQNCTTCHVAVHGSNRSPALFK